MLANIGKPSSRSSGFVYFWVGFISALIISAAGSRTATKPNQFELTIFPDKSECISEQQFKVLQVAGPDTALASELSNEEHMHYHGKTVLFTNSEGKYYYDEEIIKIPAQKCARQIGIYRYPTVNNIYKTVPVVIID